MEVQTEKHTNITKKPKKQSKAEIEEKIKAKFGKGLQRKKPTKVEDSVELTSKGVKNSTEANFGDLKSNDPNDSLTHDKIKGLLKSGGFQFNDRERQALSKILK